MLIIQFLFTAFVFTGFYFFFWENVWGIANPNRTLAIRSRNIVISLIICLICVIIMLSIVL